MPGPRWVALFATIAGLHAATAAHAADPDSPHVANPDSTHAADPDPATLDKAKALFNEGAAAYKASRYDDAVERFLEADRIAPSSALSYNVARAYEKLNEEARALQYYRDYLRRGAAAQNAEEVRKRVTELEATLASRGVQQLTVVSEPSGATLRVDGRLVGATPWTGELAPGQHQIVVSKPGRADESRAFDLPTTTAAYLELALPMQSLESSSSTESAAPQSTVEDESRENGSGMLRAGPWITLGAGGAALLGAGVFELMRRSAENEAESASQAKYREPYDRMQSHQTTARVLAGVGGALVVAGGVWALLADAGGDDDERANAATLGCTTTSCLGSMTVRF